MKVKWNEFIANSKNGTFLLDRNYMDYHSDRFKDYSLVVYHKGNIFAVFPANETEEGTIISHQGLTYGGLITDKKAKVAEICEIFKMINEYFKSYGFKKVVYKAIPWIFHILPAEEDLYALTNICHAQLFSRDISSTIILNNRPTFSQPRRTAIHHAEKNGITVKESEEYGAFWHILENNLENRYNAKPVHTLDEIQLLKSRFPQNITLFMAYKDNQPLGGTIIYDCGQVIHTQYISASPEGKATGALDILFDYIINTKYADRKYFDFGKSTENHGRFLNENLIFQKEGFGGRGVCYDVYTWEI